MSQTLVNGTTPLETVREIVATTAADRVFGTPIHEDGLTVIPVARVSGGGGGGGGTGPMAAAAESDKTTSGSGGGVGIAAKPVGVFVVREGDVRWRPAVDFNKIIMGGQIVVAVALLTIRTIMKSRSHHHHV
jgi:uncharacterized spore protein YtfJ